MIISWWTLLRVWSVWERICRENQKAHFMFNIFFLRISSYLWNNVEE